MNPPPMSLCLIGLGSNLGDRRQTLAEALARLSRHESIALRSVSSLHESAPAGGPPGQTAYLNGAALVETSLAPEALLAAMQAVETEFGRQRQERWGPRTLDLDLLLYDRLVLNTPDLTLPHPRMAWRRFVLAPAAEIAPEMTHPGIGWTVGRLLEHLNTTPWYVAIAGGIGSGKTWLAGRIAHLSGARAVLESLDLPRLDAFYHNPARHGWQIEIEFLEQRTRDLAADHPRWRQPDSPVVSDYWFDQSAALARVWLEPDRWADYAPRWEAARRGVATAADRANRC